MAHFNFVICQNAKWGHAGFYIDCLQSKIKICIPENIFLQKKHWAYHSLMTYFCIFLFIRLTISMHTGTKLEVSYFAPSIETEGVPKNQKKM